MIVSSWPGYSGYHSFFEQHFETQKCAAREFQEKIFYCDCIFSSRHLYQMGTWWGRVGLGAEGIGSGAEGGTMGTECGVGRKRKNII